MSKFHVNFKLETVGLMINNLYPHIGASPDGIVSCDCCGKGTLEVKCPYTLRNSKSLNDLFKKKSAPLVKDNGVIKMNTKHQYYFQVQMQMFVADVLYCDFMAWNDSNHIIVRVEKDQSFWNNEYPKTTTFFYDVILPELLECYYSQKQCLSNT